MNITKIIANINIKIETTDITIEVLVSIVISIYKFVTPSLKEEIQLILN